jgi:2-polyprenyl-3-methyl-5-hydroxy-6-metoxy-1,4-benzoquinol methylase
MDRLDVDLDGVLREVYRHGLSVLGRTKIGHPRVVDNPWQMKPGYPPSHDAFGRYRFLQTLRRARRLAGRRVLEIAAGGGFNAACLQEGDREVVANDLRDLEDDLEAYTTGSRIRWITGDVFALSPDALGQFDLVIAAEVIEHVAHGDRLLAHLRRFVSHGGALVLTTPNGEFFRSHLPTHSQITNFDELEKRQFAPDADGHLFLYTQAEITRLCQTAGFTQIQVELLATPFISGTAGLRFLPRWHRLAAAYNWLDARLCEVSPRLKRILCTQLIVVARSSAD